MTARPHFRSSAPAILAAVAFAALAVGCSLSRPAPVKQEFLLEVPSPPPLAKSQPATLQVRAVTVAAPFRGRSFVYRQTDLRYDSDYYTEWVVAPGAMSPTPRLARRASRAFTRGSAGSAPDGDFVLDASSTPSTSICATRPSLRRKSRSPTSSRAAIRSRAYRSGRSSTSGAFRSTARPRRSRRPRCRRLSPRSRPNLRPTWPPSTCRSPERPRHDAALPGAAGGTTSNLSGPADATRMSRCGSDIEMPASANARSIMWRRSLRMRRVSLSGVMSTQ